MMNNNTRVKITPRGEKVLAYLFLSFMIFSLGIAGYIEGLP
jgi:hypothetical protein